MNIAVTSLEETKPTNFTPAITNSGPVQVWLVDDNASLRSLIAESLERQGGIVCKRQFGSPDAVLSTLASRIGPDVILLDMHMGSQNGLDAISTIKSLSRSTRVLMLTTFYDGVSHQRAIDSGASGFLLKTDPMERLAGSICARGEEGDKKLMRSEPLRRRSAICSEEASLKFQPPKQRPDRKPSRLMRWLRQMTKN